MKHYLYVFSFLQRSIEGWGRGGRGHRISEDTAGIIGAGFKTGDSVKKKLGGGIAERLPGGPDI